VCDLGDVWTPDDVDLRNIIVTFIPEGSDMEEIEFEVSVLANSPVDKKLILRGERVATVTLASPDPDTNTATPPLSLYRILQVEGGAPEHVPYLFYPAFEVRQLRLGTWGTLETVEFSPGRYIALLTIHYNDTNPQHA